MDNDNETEPSQQNKGGTGDISPNVPPETKQVIDSECKTIKDQILLQDTDSNAGANNVTESSSVGDESSMKECGSSLKASPHESSDPPSSEVKDTEISNSSKNIPPPNDEGGGDCQQEPTQTVLPCEAHSNKTEDDAPDGAGGTASNEECGDNSAADSEETSETTVQDEGKLKSAIEDEETLPQEALAAKQNIPEKNVETIGPAPDEESTPTSDVPPSVKDNPRTKFWIAVALVALAAVLLQLLQPKSPPQKINLRQIDIFHQEMAKVKVQFPSQREVLWKRSRIHLQRHFQITQQTEPVSIILTAGVRGEVTLRCLAQSIALALSSALNASVLHIDGTSTSGQDSDTVKSDIDSQLQRAFEGGKPIAVIHRFEELPPASTLIFYRYCDHENAAFKKTFLIFTVLLEQEEDIQANIRLSEVEEMVTDHLQNKFLSNGQPTAFDKMDIDKYGGLWSRISHLILPVAAEKRIVKRDQC